MTILNKGPVSEMSVFVVFDPEGVEDGGQVFGVFSTKQKADAFIASRPIRYGGAIAMRFEIDRRG